MRRGPLLLAIGIVVTATALAADPTGTFRLASGGPVVMVLSGDPLDAVRTDGGPARHGTVNRTPGGWLDARWIECDGIDDLGAGHTVFRSESAILDPVLDPSGAVGGLVGFHVAPGGERRHEALRRDGGPAVDLTPRGFRHHLKSALAINDARRDEYDRRSGGRSRSLSRRLIWLERLTIPWAVWTDWRGQGWNRRGVPIVAADFVEMRVHDPGAPLRFRGHMSEAQCAQLDARLGVVSAELKRLIGEDRHEEVAARCVALLAEVEALEVAWGCHLAMTRHVVEQVGWASLNAATWSRMSGGETDGIARAFCKGLRLALGSAAGIDERAQAAHEVGVGVLVNDLPEIPLAAALAGLRASR